MSQNDDPTKVEKNAVYHYKTWESLFHDSFIIIPWASKIF